MLALKLTKIDPSKLSEQLRALPERMEGVRYGMGSMLSSVLRDDIRNALPSTSGWLGIYKNAIDFYYDGKQWAVAAQTDVAIDQVDASTTFIYFAATGDDPQAKVLTDYNPWVLHMVPPVDQTYKVTLKLQMVGESAVLKREQELQGVMPAITSRLSAIGLTINPLGIPTFSGRATADLKHLAYQLEFGYAPFIGKAIPHWRKATSHIDTALRESAQIIRSKFTSVLKGEKVVATPKTPQSALKAMINSARKINLPKIG